MKLGQTLANFPDIVPEQFVETLEKLHFEAPPMHFSLLREMVENELGGRPLDVFASFDEQAFAAASLGQVHRAALENGREGCGQDPVPRNRTDGSVRLSQPHAVFVSHAPFEGLEQCQSDV